MKTAEEYFRDWEAETFGFGYGTGEEHIIPSLKKFLSLCHKHDSSGYDYREIEKAVGPTVAWLLINLLCQKNVIEYGISPRVGWLQPWGAALRDYVEGKTETELLEALDYNEGYFHCTPNYCNCDGEKCCNPFFNPQSK